MPGDKRYGLVVRFKANNADDLKKFDEATKVMLKHMATDPAEDGTLIYRIHQVHDEPTVRIFYELYESKDAHTAHKETKHFKAFEAKLKDCLAYWGIVSDLVEPEELERPRVGVLPQD